VEFIDEKGQQYQSLQKAIDCIAASDIGQRAELGGKPQETRLVAEGGRQWNLAIIPTTGNYLDIADQFYKQFDTFKRFTCRHKTECGP
jgi:hypothetical protein